MIKIVIKCKKNKMNEKIVQKEKDMSNDNTAYCELIICLESIHFSLNILCNVISNTIQCIVNSDFRFQK